MIEGISTRRVESTPASDPTLGVASRQQQEQRGERQPGASASSSFGDTLSLSAEAQQALSKLQQRDREVRSHEQSHISAGGQHVSGGATYSFTKGPDGRQYATGGSVSIDTAPIPGNPEATQEKARMVRSAALAPGAPSAQDQSVAAQAASMEMQAQTEKRAEEEKGQGNGQKSDPASGQAGGQASERAGGQASDQTGSQAGERKVERLGDAQTASKAEPANAQAATNTTETASTLLTPQTSSSQGADNGRNTGFLFGAMEVQVRSDKVAALYKAQHDKFIPPTSLAPNGTGIAHTV